MEAFLTGLTLPRRVLALCAAASAALLAGAHAFERIGGLPPCLLCLDQREAHWAALFVAAVMLGFAVAGARRVVAAGLAALALVYAASTGLAGYHAGVEWGFWPGPAACAAGDPDLSGITPDDLFASLDQGGAPSCGEAPWRMLGVSMAGWNALASLGLAVLAGGACVHFAWRMDRRVVSA